MSWLSNTWLVFDQYLPWQMTDMLYLNPTSQTWWSISSRILLWHQFFPRQSRIINACKVVKHYPPLSFIWAAASQGFGLYVVHSLTAALPPPPPSPLPPTADDMNPAEIAWDTLSSHLLYIILTWTSSHGPVLIGFTFNAILLGVMFTQIYLYFTTFKKWLISPPNFPGNRTELTFRDKLWIKIFVCLFGCCVRHCVLTALRSDFSSSLISLTLPAVLPISMKPWLSTSVSWILAPGK